MASVSPTADRYPDRHLALIGLMGAGKTMVGRTCARRLDRVFVDTDDVVETTASRTVAEIFAQDGEATFRQLERVAVADACAKPVPAVIACGGGAVLDADSRRALRSSCWVIWLRVAPSTLALRVGSGAGRPLLNAGARSMPSTGNPDGGESIEQRLERLHDLRAPLYEATAHVVLDTGGCSIEEAALGVLDAFARCAS
jgi:shikimate kinase